MNWTTHVLCADCWRRENPDRQPIRAREAESETCCRCGQETHAGIYVRADPATMKHCAEEQEP
jgi:hypothetical protein